MKHKLMQLASFVFLIIGIIALIILIMAMSNRYIKPVAFLIYFCVAACLLRVDIYLLNIFYTDGKWSEGGVKRES